MLVDNEQRLSIQIARQSSPESQARKKALVIYEVLRPFTSAFHNSGNMIETVAAKKILHDEPFSLVGFWGVGGKDVPDGNDVAFLSELERIDQSILGVHKKGAKTQLILADEHGRFNGFPQEQICGYLGGIQTLAEERGIDSVWLSKLYRQWGLRLPNPQEPVNPDSEAHVIFWSRQDYARQSAQLVESAKRHNNHLGVDPAQIAYHYAAMRLQEAPRLLDTFPESVLFVNASKELAKPLLPRRMPHIYLKIGAVWFQKDGIYDKIQKGGAL